MNDNKIIELEQELKEMSSKVDILHGFLYKLFGKNFTEYCENPTIMEYDGSNLDSRLHSNSTIQENPFYKQSPAFEEHNNMSDGDVDEDIEITPHGNAIDDDDIDHGDQDHNNTDDDVQQEQEEYYYSGSSGSNTEHQQGQLFKVLDTETAADVKHSRSSSTSSFSNSPNYIQNSQLGQPAAMSSNTGGVVYPRIINGKLFKFISSNDDGKVKAECQICNPKKIIKGLASTNSNFITHLKRVHPQQYEYYSQNKSIFTPPATAKKPRLIPPPPPMIATKSQPKVVQNNMSSQSLAEAIMNLIQQNGLLNCGQSNNIPLQPDTNFYVDNQTNAFTKK